LMMAVEEEAMAGDGWCLVCGSDTMLIIRGAEVVDGNAVPHAGRRLRVI